MIQISDSTVYTLQDWLYSLPLTSSLSEILKLDMLRSQWQLLKIEHVVLSLRH